MTLCASRYDDYEWVRATRVEVARLQAMGYRVELTEWQKATVAWLLAQHLQSLPLADREAYAEEQLARASGLDWSVLEEPNVDRIIRSAVIGTMENYPDKLSATADDLTQAARIILAERAGLVRQKLKMGEPFLRRWLLDRLGDLVRHERRDTSLDALVEQGLDR